MHSGGKNLKFPGVFKIFGKQNKVRKNVNVKSVLKSILAFGIGNYKKNLYLYTYMKFSHFTEYLYLHFLCTKKFSK